MPFPEALIVANTNGKRRSDSRDGEQLPYSDSSDDYQAYNDWYQQEVSTSNQQEWHSRRRRAARQERSQVYDYLVAALEKYVQSVLYCVPWNVTTTGS